MSNQESEIDRHGGEVNRRMLIYRVGGQTAVDIAGLDRLENGDVDVELADGRQLLVSKDIEWIVGPTEIIDRMMP